MNSSNNSIFAARRFRASLRGAAGLLLGLLSSLAARPVSAHPMGNFAICHYARFQAEPGVLRLRYVLDMAEIPTVGEKDALDGNHDGVISDGERAAYLSARADTLQKGLALGVDSAPALLRRTGGDLRLQPGAGGLDTLKITLDFETALPADGKPHRIGYHDRNYAERAGWKEIVAASGTGFDLKGESVAATDRSQQLSIYPPNAIPPQDVSADFTVTPSETATIAPVAPRNATPIAPAGASPAASDPSASTVPPAVAAPNGSVAPPADNAATASATPRDAFTQTIARRELTPGLLLLGLAVAFVFGAFHALSPGHGKTMVAAYLVGTRGTAKHAVLLGIIVTVTHTLGVFALGFLTLFASRYIVPEKLYPILSLVSGVSVCGVGLWLLYSRLRGLPDGHSHDHAHDHAGGHSHSHDDADGHSHDHVHAHSHDADHAHSHSHEDAHSPSHTHILADGTTIEHSHDDAGETDAAAARTHSHEDGSVHTHDHAHPHAPGLVHAHSHSHDPSHEDAHGHLHSHDHAQDASHSHDHGHSHGLFGHHHHTIPEGPVTPRALLALGISGGIVPCPSALVVLLSAIALHRVAYGMLLITAFSFGLASVLICIGLMIVSARQWFNRLPSGGAIMARVPVFSAAAITLIGIGLIVRALGPGGP